MGWHATTKTTGKLLPALLFLSLLLPGAARADASFSAEVDRTEIGMDDSVSLKLIVSSDRNESISSAQFNAPDFELVNEYTGSFIKQEYINGQFSVQNNQTYTKVLRPTKTGDLKISGISIRVGGKLFTAADIRIQVSAAGAGTPPPQGYGGAGTGLRGAGKPVPNHDVFVRAEINKDKAYKGEQIVVSYYLYRRVRVFNIQVDKFPTLNGFLREDLEMPIMGQRLDSERVVMDGRPYDKALLARYAVYPLQDGKLKIDPMAIKYNYFGNSNYGRDDDDPFSNFFQQMAPRTGDSSSSSLEVDVVPIPEDGRPASFSGGVGDFSVTAAVDKYDVRANEAVTLTVKVEGRGNAAAIGEPKAQWPDTVELYDSKGRAKSGKAGVGEKIFEFLLIPRQPGKLELPALEFGFFDPQKKSFYTRTTAAMSLNVGEPAPGSALSLPRSKSQGTTQNAAPGSGTGQAELSGLKLPEPSSESVFSRFQIWHGLYWLALIGLGVFASLVISDFVRKSRARLSAQSEIRAKEQIKSFERIRVAARAATNGASWQEVSQAYEALSGAVFDGIDKTYQVGARGLPRSQLKEVLVQEKGLNESTWNKIDQLLEFAETVRYASSAGAVSENAARQELGRWAQEGEAIVRSLKSSSFQI